jgi:hypothetical protein
MEHAEAVIPVNIPVTVVETAARLGINSAPRW